MTMIRLKERSLKLRSCACVLLIVAALFCTGIVQAAECPQNTLRIFACNGSAGAAVNCGPPAISGKTWYLQDFFVICGIASGSTSESNITVAGLNGSGTPTYPIDESTSSVSFVADKFYGLPAAGANTAITVAMPSVSNGGACSVVMRICQ